MFFNSSDVRVLLRGSRWAAPPSRTAGRVGVGVPMDIMTGVGLVSGIIVVSSMILMGGDLHMFISEHAIIIIFGGSIAATMIRFPLSAILHGLPLGAKFAFTISRLSARDLVDDLARIAEMPRNQGPVGLRRGETDEPFLAN